MAHECPECGLICHCGGDIGDCVFYGTDYENRCTHCECPTCREIDCVCECEECGGEVGCCDCYEEDSTLGRT